MVLASMRQDAKVPNHESPGAHSASNQDKSTYHQTLSENLGLCQGAITVMNVLLVVSGPYIVVLPGSGAIDNDINQPD